MRKKKGNTLHQKERKVGKGFGSGGQAGVKRWCLVLTCPKPEAGSRNGETDPNRKPDQNLLWKARRGSEEETRSSDVCCAQRKRKLEFEAMLDSER